MASTKELAEIGEIELARKEPRYFEPLYKRYYEEVYRFVFFRIRNEAEVLDIVSQTFLNAMRGIRYQNLFHTDESRYRMSFLSDGTMIQKLQYQPDPKDTLNVFYTWDVISENALLFRNNDWEIFAREDTVLTIRRFFETEEDPCFESVTMWRYSKTE